MPDDNIPNGEDIHQKLRNKNCANTTRKSQDRYILPVPVFFIHKGTGVTDNREYNPGNEREIRVFIFSDDKSYQCICPWIVGRKCFKSKYHIDCHAYSYQKATEKPGLFCVFAKCLHGSKVQHGKRGKLVNINCDDGIEIFNRGSENFRIYDHWYNLLEKIDKQPENT